MVSLGVTLSPLHQCSGWDDAGCNGIQVRNVRELEVCLYNVSIVVNLYQLQPASHVCLDDRVSSVEMLRLDHLNSGNRPRSSRRAHLPQAQGVRLQDGLAAPEIPGFCQTIVPFDLWVI